jgi:23S rRNA pseudouridine1911/1915/1917 synthase
MLNIIYEDNHLIILNKRCGDLVQSDQTGDETLADRTKAYLKEKYNKPGKVFLGIPHRLDRPTSGLIVYTRTGKALKRMIKLFKQREVQKTYWAVCQGSPEEEAMHLTDYLYKNKEQNKSYVTENPQEDAKRAELILKKRGEYEGFSMIETELITGRHHQIRVQLSHRDMIIKGDMKYNYPEPNVDAGIHLHARRIEFVHPVRKEKMAFTADPPSDPYWDFFMSIDQS